MIEKNLKLGDIISEENVGIEFVYFKKNYKLIICSVGHKTELKILEVDTNIAYETKIFNTDYPITILSSI